MQTSFAQQNTRHTALDIFLEYSSVIWSPYTKGDIVCIEKVQRRFTKRLPGLKHLSYGRRLKHVRLSLSSLVLTQI